MECSQIAIGALHFVAAQNSTTTQRNSHLRCSSRTSPKSHCASDLFPTRQTAHSLQIKHTARSTDLPRHRCQSSQADDQHITPEPSTSGRPLPSVSRPQVFQNCCAVSAALAAAGAGIRAVAPVVSAGLFKTEAPAVQALLQIGSEDYTHHLLVTLATASIVTGARLALLAIWSDFAEASDMSNQQVLTPLTRADLIWLSCLPGISEELLFRGALIPATFADWRGAAISAIIFGVLHNNGGRNWAFAAWAGAVGLLYGTAFLSTQDLLVPAGAHCIANYASATLWLRNRSHASRV